MLLNRMDENEKWKEMLYQSQKEVINLEKEVKRLLGENEALM